MVNLAFFVFFGKMVVRRVKMEKLKNITGYWNLHDDRELEDNDMWQGTILVGDDGWFEGLIYDINGDENYKMVYGIYHSDIAIELVRVDNKNAPVTYRALKNSSGYYKGDVFADTTEGDVLCGEVRIVTQDVNHYGSYDEANNYFKEEKAYLESALDEIKKDDVCRGLYESAYELRAQTSANLLQSYFGYYPLEFDGVGSQQLVYRR